MVLLTFLPPSSRGVTFRSFLLEIYCVRDFSPFSLIFQPGSHSLIESIPPVRTSLPDFLVFHNKPPLLTVNSFELSYWERSPSICISTSDTNLLFWFLTNSLMSFLGHWENECFSGQRKGVVFPSHFPFGLPIGKFKGPPPGWTFDWLRFSCPSTTAMAVMIGLSVTAEYIV